MSSISAIWSLSPVLASTWLARTLASIRTLSASLATTSGAPSRSQERSDSGSSACSTSAVAPAFRTALAQALALYGTRLSVPVLDPSSLGEGPTVLLQGGITFQPNLRKRKKKHGFLQRCVKEQDRIGRSTARMLTPPCFSSQDVYH